MYTEVIEGSRTFADDKMQLEIYHIGAQSAHTEDYLIYYFPEHKLLMEDDLAWINEEGPLKKAGPRQAGLYKAIADRKLEVEKIIQHWPVNSEYKVKSEILFEELERSCRIE